MLCRQHKALQKITAVQKAILLLAISTVSGEKSRSLEDMHHLVGALVIAIHSFQAVERVVGEREVLCLLNHTDTENGQSLFTSLVFHKACVDDIKTTSVEEGSSRVD